MKYKPEEHHRQSTRLRGYDYSLEGLYFVTICCNRHAHLFGRISNKQMELNRAGRVVEVCWLNIPKHFPNATLHEYVIMPNHIHGIIQITGAKDIQNLKNNRLSSQPFGTSKTVGSMVRGFKIGVTKWMRQKTDVYTVWQRGFYDHIIRNEESYNHISAYILTNPENWEKDCYHTEPQPK